MSTQIQPGYKYPRVQVRIRSLVMKMAEIQAEQMGMKLSTYLFHLVDEEVQNRARFGAAKQHNLLEQLREEGGD